MDLTTPVPASLSPDNWDPTERAIAEQLQQSTHPPELRIVQGTSGLIAATLSPIANHAGIEVLKQGGTAADAATAIALTQITTALGSVVSYAGILQVVYYDSAQQQIYSLDAGWNSYQEETTPRTIPINEEQGRNEQSNQGQQGRKTLVPGFMAGVEAMQARFGRLSFSSLFEPAIWYAEHGITVSPFLEWHFGQGESFLARTAEGRKLLGQAGEGRPKAGDRFVQADLAYTLRSIAKHGASHMYAGDWGEQFVEAVRREGGHANTQDLQSYQPTWDEASSTEFVNHSIFAPGGINEGGRQLIAALNLIEAMNIDRMEPYFKDWRTFRDLSYLLQFVEFGPYTPPAAIEFQRQHRLQFSQEDCLTKEYARAMAPLLHSNPPRHSKAIVVVDRLGNVAALVHTINTRIWGTTGIVVGGIPIPDPAGFQQLRLASIQPGERVPNDMAPAIVIKDKKPIFAIGTVGSSLLAETVRILLGVFGNRLDLQTVLEAPPLLYNFRPQPDEAQLIRRTQLVPDSAYSAEFLRHLEEAGVRVDTRSETEVLAIRGTAATAEFNANTATWRSVDTPKLLGFASAY